MLLSQCNAQSVGTGAQLFLSLIQTIIAAQCASPAGMWPQDYGKTAAKRGIIDVIHVNDQRISSSFYFENTSPIFDEEKSCFANFPKKKKVKKNL